MATTRILHVNTGMDRGGVETWLVHVLRHIDRNRFRMDFLTQAPGPFAYNDEIRSRGGRILPGPGRYPLGAFARGFARALRDFGPYDVVHSHLHHYTGFVLRLAHRHGVAVRIAHSHRDVSPGEARAGLAGRVRRALMARWIDRHATIGLAASRVAGAALFGSGWGRDPRWRTLYCGIDLAPFHAPVDRAAVRAGLGLPPDAFVIGHVGRFHPQKNHPFLVEVAAGVFERLPRARLLLVGGGALRPETERRVAAAGLGNRVIFAGVRDDIPLLMKGAMDVFLLPSLYEGLPLVLFEAQAAGLPCVLSDTVSDEADVAAGMIQRLSLEAPVERWVRAVLRAGDTPEGERSRALAAVGKSPFNILHGVAELERIYGSGDDGA